MGVIFSRATPSPLEPCLQCQADSGKKNRCARDELPAPEPDLPQRLLLIAPREPVPGEAYRHAHFPYQDGPSRTGSLGKARPHVLRVCALQLVIPATRQRSVAASPAVVLVVEGDLAIGGIFLGFPSRFLWCRTQDVAACTLVPFMFY